MRDPKDIQHEGRTLAEILESNRRWWVGAGGSRANLRNANIRNANLRGAYLSGADFYGANLIGADLSGANLRDANLIGANLSGANLWGADLSCADLHGANLWNVTAVIDLGLPDGWFAVAWLKGRDMQVRVGCRSFSLVNGLKYWAGKDDRREVMAALEYAKAVARARGWDAADLEESKPAAA